MPSYYKKWVCRRKSLWIVLLAFTLAHLVLALLASAVVQSGSPSYYVLLFDLVLIAILLGVLSVVFWWCGYLNDQTPEY